MIDGAESDLPVRAAGMHRETAGLSADIPALRFARLTRSEERLIEKIDSSVLS